jgi:alpha-glucosidase
VQEAILASMERWLERGVSGFRLDVFNACHKHPDLPDNPRRWFIGGLFYGYVAQHHIHDRDQPSLAGMLAAMRSLADRHGALLVGETLDERFEYRNAAQWVGPERLHLAFHFGLLHSSWGAPSFAAAIQRHIDELGPERWPAWAIGNHDFPRLASRWGGGPARHRCLPLLLLGLRGTPFVYQGDELGLPELTPPRAQLLDPHGRRYWPFYRGRDGCRTPLPWTEAAGRGFTEGQPWLPFGAASAGLSVQRQEADPLSVLAAWRELLVLRARLPALERGEQGPIRTEGAVLCWERRVPEQKLGIFVHMGSWGRYPLPGRPLWRSGGSGALQPDQAALVEL